jgi:hypothetical protein
MPKVTKDKKNISMCVCPKCPSYNDCAKKKHEGLFCAQELGKSSCPFKTNGCICGQCPVHQTYNLKSGYYCINGSAEQVDKK